MPLRFAFSNGCCFSCPSTHWSHEMLQGPIRGGAGSNSAGLMGWSSRQGDTRSPTSLSCASHSPDSRRVSPLALMTGHSEGHCTAQQHQTCLASLRHRSTMDASIALLSSWLKMGQRLLCFQSLLGLLKGARRHQVITFGLSVSW